MPAEAQLEITDLVCGSVAKCELGARLAAHADLVRGAGVSEAVSATQKGCGLHVTSMLAHRLLRTDT